MSLNRHCLSGMSMRGLIRVSKVLHIAKKFLDALVIVGCVCIVYAGENFRLLRALLKEGWVLSPNQVESHASRLFLLLARPRWILISETG